MNPAHGSNTPLLEVSARPSVGIPDVAAVIDAIGRTVTEATRDSFGTNVRAIILTGSLSRNEGSIRKDADNTWRVHGDAEFLILLAAECPLPIEWDRERNGLQIEALLLCQGIDCSISLGYCHEDFFRAMTPHVFAYETRVTGLVVSGEFDALTLIPPFSPSDIPLEDAWRTLSNRMIELAESMAAVLKPNGDRVPDEIAYRTMKLTLDTATSLLLFEGKYAPTYLQRADNFAQLAATSEFLSNTNISLRECAEAVASCTEWKLSGDQPTGLATWNWVRTTCDRAVAIWKWELQKLSGAPSELPLEKLLQRVMQKQPLATRIRGWLYVIRCEGWFRAAAHWPGWMVKALRASPRYWTYEAAGHLFSRMNEYLPLSQMNSVERPSQAQMRSDLPLWPSGTRDDVKDWRDFARAIAFNYHRYLEGTRA